MTRAERRARAVAALRARPDIVGRGPRAPVHVHINEVVCFGFSAGSARRIADGLGSELHDLFGRSGVPGPFTLAHGAPRLDAGVVRPAPGGAASMVGRHVANAVYRVTRP